MKKNLNKSKNKIIKKNDGYEAIRDNNKLIYNINKNKILVKKDGSFVFVVALIYIIYFEILKILNYFEFYPVELWAFDIFFMLILMHLFYPQNIYFLSDIKNHCFFSRYSKNNSFYIPPCCVTQFFSYTILAHIQHQRNGHVIAILLFLRNVFYSHHHRHNK
jgi:lysylphosphatidylglycerol synthetase-like protein (DUF2156 family)